MKSSCSTSTCDLPATHLTYPQSICDPSATHVAAAASVAVVVAVAAVVAVAVVTAVAAVAAAVAAVAVIALVAVVAGVAVVDVIAVMKQPPLIIIPSGPLLVEAPSMLIRSRLMAICFSLVLDKSDKDQI